MVSSELGIDTLEGEMSSMRLWLLDPITVGFLVLVVICMIFGFGHLYQSKVGSVPNTGQTHPPL